MSGYTACHLDEIAAEQWPYWAPIRHHFDVRSFGVNAWRGKDGDEVIKRHTEEESGQEELYIVLSGHATFTVGGDDVDAPAGNADPRPRPEGRANRHREAGGHGRAVARRDGRHDVRAVGVGHELPGGLVIAKAFAGDETGHVGRHAADVPIWSACGDRTEASVRLPAGACREVERGRRPGCCVVPERDPP